MAARKRLPRRPDELHRRQRRHHSQPRARELALALPPARRRPRHHRGLGRLQRARRPRAGVRRARPRRARGRSSRASALRLGTGPRRLRHGRRHRAQASEPRSSRRVGVGAPVVDDGRGRRDVWKRGRPPLHADRPGHGRGTHLDRDRRRRRCDGGLPVHDGGRRGQPRDGHGAHVVERSDGVRGHGHRRLERQLARGRGGRGRRRAAHAPPRTAQGTPRQRQPRRLEGEGARGRGRRRLLRAPVLRPGDASRSSRLRHARAREPRARGRQLRAARRRDARRGPRPGVLAAAVAGSLHGDQPLHRRHARRRRQRARGSAATAVVSCSDRARGLGRGACQGTTYRRDHSGARRGRFEVRVRGNAHDHLGDRLHAHHPEQRFGPEHRRHDRRALPARRSRAAHWHPWRVGALSDREPQRQQRHARDSAPLDCGSHGRAGAI